MWLRGFRPAQNSKNSASIIWRLFCIPVKMQNGGKQMAGHESARTTGLYDRRDDTVALDEVERVEYLKTISKLWPNAVRITLSLYNSAQTKREEIVSAVD